MTDAIIVAVIGATASVIASYLAHSQTVAKMDARFDKSDALHEQKIGMLEDKVESLERKVEAHNNYGLQIENLKARVTTLEHHNG